MRGKVAFIVQWTLATALALALTDMVMEILFDAVLGFLMIPFFPFGGIVYGYPTQSQPRATAAAKQTSRIERGSRRPIHWRSSFWGTV